MTYRDEVAARVYNETCFVFRNEQGHEVPLDKNLVRDLLPEIQRAQIRRVVISHLLCDCLKGYLYYTTATEHYRTTDGNRYELAFSIPFMQPRDFRKSFLLYIREMLSEWIGLPVGERAFGEKTMIDFLLDGIIEVDLVGGKVG